MNLDKLMSFKLKINDDKEETSLVEAVGLLDHYRQELTSFSTKLKECYGSHFPELAKIVQDNVLYAKAVKLMGNRTNAANLDFSQILPKEIEVKLKEASVNSKSNETAVSDLFLVNVNKLCDHVLSFAEDTEGMLRYIVTEMHKMAPNLTALVGLAVGARLVAHCGSLSNLANQPGSSILMLGAEKASWGAFKYGFIRYAPLVIRAAPKHKRILARALAARTALAAKCDLMGDGRDNSKGLNQD